MNLCTHFVIRTPNIIVGSGSFFDYIDQINNLYFSHLKVVLGERLNFAVPNIFEPNAMNECMPCSLYTRNRATELLLSHWSIVSLELIFGNFQT